MSERAASRFKEWVSMLVDEFGSHAAVAERIGTSKAYIGNVARDEVQNVRVATLRAAAASMGLSPAFFDSDAAIEGWRLESTNTKSFHGSVGLVSFALRDLLGLAQAAREDGAATSGQEWHIELANGVLNSNLVRLARDTVEAEDEYEKGRAGTALAAALAELDSVARGGDRSSA